LITIVGTAAIRIGAIEFIAPESPTSRNLPILYPKIALGLFLFMRRCGSEHSVNILDIEPPLPFRLWFSITKKIICLDSKPAGERILFHGPVDHPVKTSLWFFCAQIFGLKK
jgi:hypothetical protein